MTYTDGDPIASPEQYEWNHGLGEIVQAVIDAGLRVTALREHTEIEWQGAVGTWWKAPTASSGCAEMPERLPLMFTLEARQVAGQSARFASITGLQDRSRWSDFRELP